MQTSDDLGGECMVSGGGGRRRYSSKATFSSSPPSSSSSFSSSSSAKAKQAYTGTDGSDSCGSENVCEAEGEEEKRGLILRGEEHE